MRDLSQHYTPQGPVCVCRAKSIFHAHPHSFSHVSQRSCHILESSHLAHVLLKPQFMRDFFLFFFMPQPFPCKGVMTGVGVYLGTCTCSISLTGSNRHQRTLCLYPLYKPRTHPTSSSSSSPRCSGNWVWHRINRERARTHLNAPDVVFLTSLL